MEKLLMTNLRNRFGTLVRAEAKKNPKLRASNAIACFDRAMAEVLLDQLGKTAQVCHYPKDSAPSTPGQVIFREYADE